MRFRSLLYVVIALVSLGISIPMARLYGGIGCALGIAFALVCGQIIAMNIYYHKRIHIEIIRFWIEIAKMSPIPLGLGIIFYFFLRCIPLDTVWQLGLGIVVFTVIYIPLFWFMGMNQYERDLFSAPVKKILGKCFR